MSRSVVAYQPGTGTFTVNLEAGDYSYEWFDVAGGGDDSCGLFGPEVLVIPALARRHSR